MLGSLLLFLLVLSTASSLPSLSVSAFSAPFPYSGKPIPSYIYVANSGSNTVSVINGTNNKVVKTISVGYDPDSIAFDPETGWIYVANAGHPHGGDGNISVISPFTNKVIKTFDGSASGRIIVVKGKLWVTNAYPGVGFISIISPRNGSTLDLIDACNCSQIIDEVYSPATNEVYAVPLALGNISVISPRSLSVVGHLKIPGKYAGGIAFDPQNNDLYISYDNNTVLVVNQENKVIKTIKVGYDPNSITYDSANHDIYVANVGSNTTSIISSITNKVVAIIKKLGSSSLAMSFDRLNGELYVANWAQNTVTVVKGKTIIDRINVGNSPNNVAVS